MMLNRKTLLPLLVLIGGLAASLGVIAARPEIEARAPEVLPPLVRAVTAVKSDVRFSVSAQGTVMPRTESNLVPEVSGRIVWMAPSLVSGGFFGKGEPLIRLDRRDYEIAVSRSEAALARQESQLSLARANLERSQLLRERGIVSASAMDEAESTAQVAEAALREARAALDQARIDLERTEIVAPFDGRVREEQIDVGEFVNRGTPVARLYAVDYAEIRLPIPDDQLAFLDLPFEYRGKRLEGAGPEVILRARFGQREHEWRGRIVRTEGEIDPRSRVVHVVARVDGPYDHGGDSDRPPLAVGLFVDAEILGRVEKDVVVLPRVVLREQDRVLVVDAEDHLRFRAVRVLRADRESVVIGTGLEEGERVCVSPLDAVVDGMKVRVYDGKVAALADREQA